MQAEAALPDAPQPQRTAKQERREAGKVGKGSLNKVFGVYVGPAYPRTPDTKWDTYVIPGQKVERLTGRDKFVYFYREQTQPIVLVPALLSAGWGQLTDANPHYGVDAGGFGERFGAAMLRQASDRFIGDGLMSAVLRQDPRFYRVTNGRIVERGLGAVRQTFVRHGDDGSEELNAAGLIGHAAANYLAMTYYPHVSAGAGVATAGFATSVAGDMGAKLVLEFGPDLLRLAFRRHQ